MNCASCGRDLGNTLLGLEWCPHERAYFCSACTKKRAACPVCRSRPSDVRLGVLGLMLLVTLVLGSALILPQHISRSLDIQTANTDIANMSAGQEVKVLGQIRCVDRIAFTLFYRDGEWQLKQHSNFTVVDKNGDQVRLDLLDCHDFQPGTHNVSSTDRNEYWNGDKVTALGKVGDDEAGNKTMEVRRIYPGERDPYELTPGWFQALWAIPAVAAIHLGVVAVWYRHHRKLHAIYLGEHPAAAQGALDIGVEDKDIAWNVSPLLEQERKRSRLLSILSAILLVLILVTSALQPRVWKDEAIAMASAGLLMMLTITLAFYYRENMHITPVALGMSQKGVHLRYLTKRQGPARVISIPWPQLIRYTSDPGRKRIHVELYSEKRVDQVILPREFKKTIDEEDLKRKKATVPAATGP